MCADSYTLENLHYYDWLLGSSFWAKGVHKMELLLMRERMNRYRSDSQIGLDDMKLYRDI